ncbi:hypothetical protein KP509_21G080100 [Ceratopteris richardii]|uniref:Uncharacterized protein n=3 Tax=Ceratopteris richardii TaxID=49495 RepID=A0A8T2SBR7_CERRI|nr:hypothetical protein KP509_21G080100 [Ceratopteris richardii]
MVGGSWSGCSGRSSRKTQACDASEKASGTVTGRSTGFHPSFQNALPQAMWTITFWDFIFHMLDTDERCYQNKPQKVVSLLFESAGTLIPRVRPYGVEQLSFQ